MYLKCKRNWVHETWIMRSMYFLGFVFVLTLNMNPLTHSFIHYLRHKTQAHHTYLRNYAYRASETACLSVIYVSYVIYWWFRITLNRTKLIMHIWTDTFLSWKHMHQYYACSHGTASITLLFIIKNWFFKHFKFTQNFQFKLKFRDFKLAKSESCVLSLWHSVLLMLIAICTFLK